MKVTLTVEYQPARAGVRPEYSVNVEPEFDCIDKEVVSIAEDANNITQRGDARNPEHVLRWVLDEIERDPFITRHRTWMTIGSSV